MRKILKNPSVWAIVLLVLVITISSSQNAETSNGYSMKIAGAIYSKLPHRFQGSEAVSRFRVILKINLVIRKIAHSLVFAALTALMLNATKTVQTHRVSRYALILAAILILAAADEIHQMFTGRGASVTDVLIDLCGALCVYGIIGINKLFRRFLCRNKKD